MREMETVAPKRIADYIKAELGPEDQDTYWRISWYIGAYKESVHRESIVKKITFPLIAVVGLTLRSFPAMMVALVFCLASRTWLQRRSRQDLAVVNQLFASNPVLWHAIGVDIESLKRECSPNEPMVPVSFTLPD